MTRSWGGPTRVCSDRRGSALLDVLVAAVVLAVAVLASTAVVRRGIQTASRARFLRVSVSATRDVVDSLTLAGARAQGSRQLPPVTVVWTPVGGGLFRFEAFAPDTLPPAALVIHHDVPPPIP